MAQNKDTRVPNWLKDAVKKVKADNELDGRKYTVYLGVTLTDQSTGIGGDNIQDDDIAYITEELNWAKESFADMDIADIIPDVEVTAGKKDEVKKDKEEISEVDLNVLVGDIVDEILDTIDDFVEKSGLQDDGNKAALYARVAILLKTKL